MRIILSFEDTKNTTIRRDTLVFNLDALHWDKNKIDCWNLKLDRTGLSSPFASVFLKR
jgi:hypothetical protein